jgi:hypothetical protein
VAERANTRFHGRYEQSGRICEAPGCEEPGEFRAPPAEGPVRGDRPGRFRWFCLEHVRAFNQGYNFFNGMSPDEIHQAQRPMAGWEETRVYSNGGADRPPRWADFADPLDAIGARFAARRAATAERKDGKALSGQDRESLRTLGLEVDADRAALRRRYSDLVRRYHPDRNGGDRSHEAQLAKVIAAYQQLRKAAAFA